MKCINLFKLGVWGCFGVYTHESYGSSIGFLSGASNKEPTYQLGDIRDTSSIPGLGRSPGGGHGNPLQYSCPESPMDRGAWQAILVQNHKELGTTEVT